MSHRIEGPYDSLPVISTSQRRSLLSALAIPSKASRLNVFGAVHRKGQLLLVLVLPDGSKSSVPADWTNLASPTPTLSAPSAATLGSLEHLLHARAVLDALLGRLASATGEGGNSTTKESSLARDTSKPLRSSPRRNVSLGNPARATPT